MARSEMLVKVTSVVVLMWMVVSTIVPHHAEAAISCVVVTRSVLPCLDYLQRGGIVPAACCNGVNNLYNNAKTTADRQTTCGCLKTDATLLPGINITNAAGLPAKCGLTLHYKISPSTNCS
ncbi:Non-specific lipid-transfer protein, partial [Actinidia chinensis var. chinensis]